MYMECEFVMEDLHQVWTGEDILAVPLLTCDINRVASHKCVIFHSHMLSLTRPPHTRPRSSSPPIFQRTDAGGVDMNRMWLTPMAPTLPALHHTLRLMQAYSSHPSFQVPVLRVRQSIMD